MVTIEKFLSSRLKSNQTKYGSTFTRDCNNEAARVMAAIIYRNTQKSHEVFNKLIKSYPNAV